MNEKAQAGMLLLSVNLYVAIVHTFHARQAFAASHVVEQ